MVPTKRFWWLVALGIPVAVLAGFSGSLLPLWVYNLLLLLTAYLTYRMAPSISGLSVQRVFDPVLSVRVPNKILLRVHNDGVQDLVGEIRDEPPPQYESTPRQFRLNLETGRERDLTYQVTPHERGSDYFRGTYLRLHCPLGLVYRQVKLNTEQPVRVYPNVLALREFDLLKQKGKLNQIGIRMSRVKGLGSDFESLREYAEGDDFRKVDWKATARKGKLVVRQFEQERNQPVIIVIDVGRRMLSEVDGVTKLDHALDSLLMLTHAAAMAGDFIGLLVYSDRVKRYIPPRKGRNQVGLIIEAIHDLVAEPVESDPAGAYAYLATRWKRRSLIVNFTDVESPEEARSLSGSLGSIARRHLTLLVRVADPRLKELVQLHVHELEDLYRKASALTFSEERMQASSVLSSSGLHSLESEPQDLAASLVSFYFMVKERSLL